MNINKPKFWDKKIGIISIILLPLSLVFILLIFLKKKLTKENVFKIPIICIGNIYLGGTGKTPVSIFLAKELSRLGKKPAILRKYYKNHNDEYNLIKDKFHNLVICKNRIDGLEKIDKSDSDIAILDDGLQDYSFKKNLKVICFNNNQKIGNGLVLPSGPLRENLNVLKETEIVIINGNRDKKFEQKILDVNKKIDIFYSTYKPININQFKNKKLLALAGIGNPENFFKLIEDNNLKIEKKLIFPDHYKFSKSEIQNIIDSSKKKNYKIIMTEKDYFKIKDLNIIEVNYLKISLEIDKKEVLLEKIKKLYDKNN
tara:strand:+ start:4277 stop:5218 length:942 start_codon:yes stop_codon:yes gene_type:complete